VIWLRSLLFNVLFFAWTGFVLLLCVPCFLVPRVAVNRLGRMWARGTVVLLRAVVGARFEFRGDRARLAGPALVASKHQSAFDTMVFYLLGPDPAYVMKAELLRIPIYGWLGYKQRMIPVDRAGGGAALKGVLRGAERAIAERRQVIIFPQGTRTPPGGPAEAHPYLPGVTLLYQSLAMPVTPVALNSGLVWGRRSFRKFPGTMVVELLPDIEPGLKRGAFMRRLQETIETGTRRLEAEGRSKVFHSDRAGSGENTNS
jgi:1-acyl-sn-glycerol-3-phosphate acyltransferase